MAYRTECQTTLPEAYQMTTEKQTDILPKLPTKMATGRSVSTRPYQMLNQEMPKSAYAMYKAAFREQKRAPIAVSMTTQCEAYVLDMDQ